MLVLHVMRNTMDLDNTLLQYAVTALTSRLPEGWQVSVIKQDDDQPGSNSDALLEILALDGSRAVLLLEAKERLTPRQAAEIAPKVRERLKETRASGALVVSSFLSELARDRLQKAGANYLDMTGNARVALQRPALLIETQGAVKDPSPPPQRVRSLKGSKASRIVRALCDWRPPLGVRQLARRTESDAGYVSRVLDLLGSEDLVERGRKDEVSNVDWQGLIRRWTVDYGVTKTNRTLPCLAPRGLEVFTGLLPEYGGRFAITGTLAVPTGASVVPSRVAICYIDDPEGALGPLGLRRVEAGANVLLLKPFDTVVYQRSRAEGQLVLVALSQCLADLMTGGGRDPVAAETLREWMARNEDAWRS
jgi:hypothetical protein